MMQICLKSYAKKLRFRKYFTPVNEIYDRKKIEKKIHKQNKQTKTKRPALVDPSLVWS